MLYKEWRSVRYKFWLYLGAYTVFAFLLTFVWSGYNFGGYWRTSEAATFNNHYNPGWQSRYPGGIPIFLDWLYISAAITAIGAVFGGMGAVAEEKDKGTLGFLLSKPVTRAQIYNTKIWLNVAGLLIAYALITPVVFVIDQTGPAPAALELLPVSLLVMLAGITVVCLTVLISIFAHNVIQTLTFSLAILIATVAIYIFVVGFFSNSFFIEGHRLSTVDIMLFGSAGVAGLALIVYPVGLYCFERREF